jgi:hypothetical protein
VASSWRRREACRMTARDRGWALKFFSDRKLGSFRRNPLCFRARPDGAKSVPSCPLKTNSFAGRRLARHYRLARWRSAPDRDRRRHPPLPEGVDQSGVRQHRASRGARWADFRTNRSRSVTRTVSPPAASHPSSRWLTTTTCLFLRWEQHFDSPRSLANANLLHRGGRGFFETKRF